jgi:D-alanine transaminase/branched-chain amino acid aminotransferase
MNYIAIDGELVKADEARLHVSDLGLLRGYALFDFFRVSRGVPLFLDDYLTRFFRSAERLAIPVPLGRAALTQLIETLLAANQQPESAVRMVLTGGYSDNGFTPGKPNLIVMQHEAPRYPETLFTQGAHLMSYPYVRDIPEVKSTNYALVLALQPKLKELGALDVIWHDGKIISESSRSNVFIVDAEGVVRTPARNVLLGITRQRVLELARERYPTREDAITLEELRRAREVFLTSTTKGIMPVSMLDGEPIGGGKPGPVTLELRAALAATAQRYLETVKRDAVHS